jgi:hypothetical protein
MWFDKLYEAFKSAARSARKCQATSFFFTLASMPLSGQMSGKNQQRLSDEFNAVTRRDALVSGPLRLS